LRGLGALYSAQARPNPRKPAPCFQNKTYLPATSKSKKQAMEKKWAYGGALLLGAYSAYQLNELRKFSDNMQIGMSLQGAAFSAGTLSLRVVVTVSNPSKVSMKIKTPFVKIYAPGQEEPFAHSAPALETKTIPAYGSVSFPVVFDAGLFSLASGAAAIVKKALETGEIALNAVAETEVPVLFGLIRFRKTDKAGMSRKIEKKKTGGGNAAMLPEAGGLDEAAAEKATAEKTGKKKCGAVSGLALLV
jgi:hypothetical protein